jgi:hypothetical protein
VPTFFEKGTDLSEKRAAPFGKKVGMKFLCKKTDNKGFILLA